MLKEHKGLIFLENIFDWPTQCFARRRGIVLRQKFTFWVVGGGGGGSIQLTEEVMFSHTVLFVCLNMAKVMWGPVLPQSPFTHALNSIFLLKG